ncbi:glycerophosphodiester phosphodiesterase [Aquibacillus kalidii]|uniref:glycerophosphodiester phosphodiesterase n=1 Tax=Aquibacillus kalidii TaxID=2762597 RepID=UPI00164766C1
MKTIIFAHRGASKLAPENTMPAFDLAYQMGADGIETDVQLTKDHVPVLIHDENVRRTTDGTGFVQDYTLEELQKLDAGSWFSEHYAGTTIISLDQFLSWIKDKNLKINIELKNNVIDYKNLEKIVYDLLKKYDVLTRTVISTFNAESVKRLEGIDKDLTTAFLTSSKIKDLVGYSKNLGATGLHIRYRLLNRSIVRNAHSNNMYVATYTVNRPTQIMRCFKLGCHAIFTDVPHVAIDTRKQFETKANKDSN